MKPIKQGELLFIALLLGFLVTGCNSAPQALSEESVFADLQVHPDFYSAQEINIDDWEITKRQTNPDDLYDKIYITINASNEQMSCTLNYLMEYGLYNDGWNLDSVMLESSSGVPLTGVTQEAVSEYIDITFPKDEFDIVEVQSKSEDLHSGNATITFLATDQRNYGSYLSTYVQSWKFDQTLLMFVPIGSPDRTSYELAWSEDELLGTWTYTDSGKGTHIFWDRSLTYGPVYGDYNNLNSIVEVSGIEGNIIYFDWTSSGYERDIFNYTAGCQIEIKKSRILDNGDEWYRIELPVLTYNDYTYDELWINVDYGLYYEMEGIYSTGGKLQKFMQTI